MMSGLVKACSDIFRDGDQPGKKPPRFSRAQPRTGLTWKIEGGCGCPSMHPAYRVYRQYRGHLPLSVDRDLAWSKCMHAWNMGLLGVRSMDAGPALAGLNIERDEEGGRQGFIF